MTVAPTAARSKAPNTRVRWAVLGLLLGIIVAGLVVSALVVLGRGVPGDRIDSLRNPPASASAEREKVLAAGRTFVERFNTYGPDLLDDSGHMPRYAAVGDLMTAKFRTVFDKNVGYAEQTVKETKISRTGKVYGVGVASMDADSAELLVAGIVEFAYPDPKGGKDPIQFEPLRFRYQVSMVKVGGAWQVDDLDDVDDDLPSFAEASIPEGATPGGAPSGQPSQGSSQGPSPQPEEGSAQ